MIQAWDFAVLDFIQSRLRCEALDWLMPKITLLGEMGLLWIAVAVVLLIVKSRRLSGAALSVGLIGSLLIGNLLLKNLVARPRPCWLRPEVVLLIPSPQDFSFPSGHTLSCFIAATVLLRYDKRLGIPALAIAVAVAFSRLYLYVHFPTDVLAGILLGIAVGLGAILLTETAARRIGARSASCSRE